MSSLKDKLNKIYNSGQKNKKDTSDIRKQLNRIYRKKRTQPCRSREGPDLAKLIDVLNGKRINSNNKEVIVVNNQYDMGNLYGDINLREVYNYTQKDYQQYLNIDNIKYPEQLLFIDTETTGLAGGTGTIAFMVGLGWIEKQQFYTLQYFLPKLNAEKLMLQKLKNRSDRFGALVSYNGKSFDLPMLTSRFLLNRLDPIPENIPHIDLLHTNRALWRYSSENCKLQTMEADKFGFYREDDIPGELIPTVYFNYLNGRGGLEKVVNIFHHNRYDIISMLANLICIFRSFTKKTPSDNPLEDYAKGRHFRRRKKIERSINHFKNVLKSDITDNRRFKTLMELAGVYKKQKKYQQAVPLWKKAAGLELPTINPLIELAKYYEHRAKDYQKAVEYTRQALDIIDENDIVNIEKLQKRQKRVTRKLNRENKK